VIFNKPLSVATYLLAAMTIPTPVGASLIGICCPQSQVWPEYGFFPQGVTQWEDAVVTGYCDLDPDDGTFVDFNGRDHTYDGHFGHDCAIRGFDEQNIGVPVFAVMDGTVIEVLDGHDDRNLNGGPTYPVNIVKLDHGNGLWTRYIHLKKWSTTVVLGQYVKAGQQIGQTGSSGSSLWPHLHFESRMNGEFFEPNAGPFRPGPSNWLNQIPAQYDFAMWDANLGPQQVAGWAGPPFEFIRRGTYSLGSQNVIAEYLMRNLPANSTWQRIVRDPTGAIRQNSGVVPFGNPTVVKRRALFNGANPVNLNMVGTWTVDLRINGASKVVLPFKVVATPAEIVNRPPNPFHAELEPITPDVDLPVFCRVKGDLIFDDPDYDVVRYRYLWKVDGLVVRDMVSAGRADCIPHESLVSGKKVECIVTPSDGVQDGQSVTATVREAVGSVIARVGTVDGGAREVRFDDDRKLVAEPGPAEDLFATPIILDFIGESHASSVGSIKFTMDSRVQGTLARQTVSLFDYVLGDWVEIDNRTVGDPEESVSYLAATDPARFIGPGGEIRARVMYLRIGPPTFEPWSAEIDQVQWATAP